MTTINQPPQSSSQMQALKTRQAQFLKEMAMKKKGDAPPEAKRMDEVVADIKTRRMEALLSAETESKKTFAWQSGIKERAAAQGFDLEQLEYNGRPLTELTPEEATELVAEDGYFGVKQTSQRLADFVITGGGDDLQRLQAGRDGIIRGFNEAEKIWGGKLPEISYQTLEKALATIDERIQEMGGGTVVDVQT